MTIPERSAHSRHSRRITPLETGSCANAKKIPPRDVSNGVILRARALRALLAGGFFLAVIFLVPSSGRANDFVKLGSPFANPVNLYGISTVYDRIPSTYEAWAVGEEIGTGKGVLLYFNGTFWSNIPLDAGTPGLTSVSGQRFLTTQDACYGTSSPAWKSVAWAVGKQGTMLKLDPYTNTWNAEKKVNVPVCSGGSNNGILCDTALNIAACGTAGYRTAESFEGEAANAPLLHVEYVPPSVPNAAPTVSAGPDQTIQPTAYPANVQLDGAVADDGLPNPPGIPTTTWSTTQPSLVSFDNVNLLDATATFSQAGTYVLTLTANDGALSAYDDVQITVQGPTVIERRVATGIDDAEENASGTTVSLTSSVLELVNAGAGNDQKVGMRFQSISVPKDAIITNAYIQFKTDNTDSTSLNLTIKGQASDDALSFTTAANNVSSRSPTTANVPWSPLAWNTLGEAGAAQRTPPEFKDIIQEIVSSPGWGSGNALAIIITGTGRRRAESYEGDAAGGPLLHIEYLPTTASRVIGTRVAIGTDDAEESASGSMRLTSSDLELTNDPSDAASAYQKVGMRFQGVSVPQGATITKAYVQFAVEDATNNVDPADLTIKGEAADDPVTFSSTPSTDKISSRATTGAAVTWSSPSLLAWNTVGEAGANQRTPDLKNVIQEIVSRPGWQSNNDLAIIITGTGRRTAESYEGSTPLGIRAPLLLVEYVPPNAAPTVSAGLDQTITLPDTDVALDGAVADDGLPNPPGSVSTTWSRAGGTGTGTVSFADASARDTTVSGLTSAGTYILRLTANDGSLSSSADVTITVQPEPSPPVINTRVAISTDDAEESVSGGVDLESNDLQLAYNAGNQTVGMRFGSVAIPPGSTITNAYIQFKADQTQSEATTLTIQGQAANNADTFTASLPSAPNYDVSSRPRTTAVTWTPPAWTVGDVGDAQKTPDLTSVIQEIVSIPGWASGNALAIITSTATGTSGGGSCLPPTTTTRGCTAAELKKPPVCVGGTNAGAACTIGGSQCTGGTCTNICANWTSIDFNAVAAAHDSKAIAVGLGNGSTRPLFEYAETLDANNAATTCANNQLRQHVWTATTDTNFATTDDVRAAYYIDKDHAWLAGKDGSGDGKVWKYSQKDVYTDETNAIPQLTAAANNTTFTSVAATFHPTITPGQPLRSLVWLGSEPGKIFRYDEASGSVSQFMAVP